MERFEYVTSLGEGAYGTVWLCKNRDTNQKVAMKRFKDAHVDPEVMRLALREIRLLKAAQHKNVVQLLEAFRSKSGRVYIVMEYVERTLTQDLRKYTRGFPPVLVKMVTWQLLQAISFLHRNRIIHRDLKPANILLTGDNVVKLCDFGFARMMHPQVVADYTTYVVTRWYRPPEVLVSDEYGPKVDVWAIGCLFSEMASGRPLFPGKTSADQLWLTMRTLGALPGRQTALMLQDPLYTGFTPPGPSERTSLEQRFPQFTPDMMHLLRGCLALDPAQRWTADEALQAPYFDDVPRILEAMNAAAAANQDFWAMVDSAWRSQLAAAQAPRTQPVPIQQQHAQLQQQHASMNGRSLSQTQQQLMQASLSQGGAGGVSQANQSRQPTSNPSLTSSLLGIGQLLSPDALGTPCSATSTASRMTAPMAPLPLHLQRGGPQAHGNMSRASYEQNLGGIHRLSSTGFSEATTTLTVLSGTSVYPTLSQAQQSVGHSAMLHSCLSDHIPGSYEGAEGPVGAASGRRASACSSTPPTQQQVGWGDSAYSRAGTGKGSLGRHMSRTESSGLDPAAPMSSGGAVIRPLSANPGASAGPGPSSRASHLYQALSTCPNAGPGHAAGPLAAQVAVAAQQQQAAAVTAQQQGLQASGSYNRSRLSVTMMTVAGPLSTGGASNHASSAVVVGGGSASGPSAETTHASQVLEVPANLSHAGNSQHRSVGSSSQPGLVGPTDCDVLAYDRPNGQGSASPEPSAVETGSQVAPSFKSGFGAVVSSQPSPDAVIRVDNSSNLAAAGNVAAILTSNQSKQQPVAVPPSMTSLPHLPQAQQHQQQQQAAAGKGQQAVHGADTSGGPRKRSFFKSLGQKLESLFKGDKSHEETSRAGPGITAGSAANGPSAHGGSAFRRNLSSTQQHQRGGGGAGVVALPALADPAPSEACREQDGSGVNLRPTAWGQQVPGQGPNSLGGHRSMPVTATHPTSSEAAGLCTL